MIFNNLRNSSDYKRKSNVNGKKFFSNTFSTLQSKIIIIKISMIYGMMIIVVRILITKFKRKKLF